MKLRGPVELRLVALCTTWLLLPALACPAQCVCKWKGGKRYVECVGKELNQVPSSIDAETQVLDFAGNDLSVLQDEIFEKLGLIDLQKIYLQRCRIHKVDNFAFKGVANLVELDLSYNYLTVIPSPNFGFFPSLMRLSLNNNPITTIKTHCFQHLTYLNTLELSECKIDTVEEDAFSGLLHLEWLRLNGNKITTVRRDSMFPDSLRGIDLENNRWHCDCQMIDLHDWLLKFSLPHAVEPTCSTPERLWKRKITSVAAPDLACPPKMSPSSIYLETNEGNNITLECLIKATPEAEISWKFRGQPIQNDTLDNPEVKIAYTVVGSIDKRSELLIFNVNRDDNGTYTCVARNVAGHTLANFTLKVIIKEEPVIVVVSFPRKHLVIIVTGVFLVIVLLIAIVAVALLKFKTDTKSRKKKDCGKDVALRNRASNYAGEATTLDPMQRKFNGSVITNAQTHHVVHYTIQDNIKNMVDRNPDLVNDAETVTNNMYTDNGIMSVYKTPNARMEEDGTFSLPTLQRQVTWRDQQAASAAGSLPSHAIYNMYQHSADVHLNPDCFLDSEGYPYDYGLPKVQCRSAPIHPNYAVVAPGYQTLPHNRPKAQKLACKFAKDTEFNTPTCFNYVQTNFRHTLEGYPIIQNRQVSFAGNGGVFINQAGLAPSPPEGYKTEPVSLCCGAPSAEACGSWGNPKGTCAVMVPMEMSEASAAKCYHVETRCVDTQTTDMRPGGCGGGGGGGGGGEGAERLKPALKPASAKCELEVCTESPDEGYVGDAVDAGDT